MGLERLSNVKLCRVFSSCANGLCLCLDGAPHSMELFYPCVEKSRYVMWISGVRQSVKNQCKDRRRSTRRRNRGRGFANEAGTMSVVLEHHVLERLHTVFPDVQVAATTRYMLLSQRAVRDGHAK